MADLRKVIAQYPLILGKMTRRGCRPTSSNQYWSDTLIEHSGSRALRRSSTEATRFFSQKVILNFQSAYLPVEPLDLLTHGSPRSPYRLPQTLGRHSQGASLATSLPGSGELRASSLSGSMAEAPSRLQAQAPLSPYFLRFSVFLKLYSHPLEKKLKSPL